jgi:hydroxymethylpyrimidine pyrophosphatase-like HAD family hydrolase
MDSNKIMLFVDLDDTLFQTKRKNLSASIPATKSPNTDTISYMSDVQKSFLDLFSNFNSCSIIPVTARDYDQYSRTFISQDPNVEYASIYFGAEILFNNEIDPIWNDKVKYSLKKSSTEIKILFHFIKNKINTDHFYIYNIKDYYLVIKCKNRENYKELIIDCLNFITEFIPDDFLINNNDNNISIVPKCIDKMNAVEYLIDKNAPIMTIGMGDSLSDWNFMDICDYKIIPKISQINNEINQKNII